MKKIGQKLDQKLGQKFVEKPGQKFGKIGPKFDKKIRSKIC